MICKDCKAFHSSGSHKCPPAWDVWLYTLPNWLKDNEMYDKPDAAYGATAGDAAEWAAENLGESDGDDQLDVWLRLLYSENEPEHMIVEIRQEVSYYATRG